MIVDVAPTQKKQNQKKREATDGKEEVGKEDEKWEMWGLMLAS